MPPPSPVPLYWALSRAQTRYTCASALCKIALRLPDPVRFDAYCFLKGLADSAALFPLVVQQPRGEGDGDATAPDAGAGAGGAGDGLLQGYRREQELLSERVENGASACASAVLAGFDGPGFACSLGLFRVFARFTGVAGSMFTFVLCWGVG